MHTVRRGRVGRPIVLTILLGAIVLAACGSSAGSALSPAGEEPQAGASAPAAGGAGTGDGRGAGEAPLPTGSSEEPDGMGAAADAKIIRTGTMDLEVSDLPGAIGAARRAILGLGGYIGASNTSNVDDQPFAEITYRIPVDRWEDALDALRGLNGLTQKVVAEQTQSVDVTAQVVDLDARIRNLRASETALQTIASEATRVTDLLEIQAQITQVRGQIEQLEAQRNELGDRTAYATLAARFQLPLVAAVEIQSEAWNPGRIFDEASASLVGLLQTLAGAGIWLVVVWLPVVLLISIIIALAVWTLRRLGVIERPMRPAAPASSGE
jgi:hypothetical protein